MLAAADAKGEASLVFTATDCHAARDEERSSGNRPCAELIYVVYVSQQGEAAGEEREMTNNIVVFLPITFDGFPLC